MHLCADKLPTTAFAVLLIAATATGCGRDDASEANPAPAQAQAKTVVPPVPPVPAKPIPLTHRLVTQLASESIALYLRNDNAYAVKTQTEQTGGRREGTVAIQKPSGELLKSFVIAVAADPLIEVSAYIEAQQPIPLSRTVWPSDAQELAIGALDITLLWQDSTIVLASANGPRDLLRVAPKPKYSTRPRAIYADAINRRLIVTIDYDPGQDFTAGFARFARAHIVDLRPDRPVRQ